MKRLIAQIVLAAALAGCSGADEPASRAVVDQFHAALNAGDWAAIHARLSPSARDLRPGGGTARAFRAIARRHGRYLGGQPASITAAAGGVRIIWAAQYQAGPVREYFVLVKAGGQIRIDSYSDKPTP